MGEVSALSSTAIVSFVFGLTKQRCSKCDLRAVEFTTKCNAIATLFSVGWLRQPSKSDVVEARTYTKELCKSFKIARSSCGQLTSWEISTRRSKCASGRGSPALRSAFLKNEGGEGDLSSKLEDPLSSNDSSVRRKAEGTASPDEWSFLTSLWDGSSDKLEMKRVRESLSK